MNSFTQKQLVPQKYTVKYLTEYIKGVITFQTFHVNCRIHTNQSLEWKSHGVGKQFLCLKHSINNT